MNAHLAAMNITTVPDIIVSIFKGAFHLKSAAGGAVGSGIALAMQMGMKRAPIFNSEDHCVTDSNENYEPLQADWKDAIDADFESRRD